MLITLGTESAIDKEDTKRPDLRGLVGPQITLAA